MKVRETRKIVERYKIPFGRMSADIFELPCVHSAIKTDGGKLLYLIQEPHGIVYASGGDELEREEDGTWHVVPEYEQENK